MALLARRLQLDYVGRRLREDWPALLILAALLVLAAGSVAVADWAPGLWLLPTIGLAALIAGYFLAISHFSEFTTILLGVVYGLFTVWIVLARNFLPESFDMRQRMIEVLTRTGLWVEQVTEGGFSRDNLMFMLSLSLIVWLLGFSASANMFRSRRLWYAVIPPGLALLINTYYYAGEARLDFFLIAYLFFAFTLAVRTNAIVKERLWRVKRVGYTPGIRFDLVRAGMIAGVLMIALAWMAPAASASSSLADAWDRSVNPWHRVQDTFQRLFGGVQGGTAVTADYYGGPTLTMGGPVNLSNATVMYAYAPSGFRYYWRSKVFDAYSNGQWSTTTDARHVSDFGILGSEESTQYLARRTVQQRFEMAIRASRLVYAAPQPVSFASLPISYDVVYTIPGSEDFVSVETVRARDTLSAGDSYNATSAMSIADEASLRTAGTNYPAWVTGRYLALPETITPRTIDLARTIAASSDNPYDQARAVEAWLRTNITYNQTVAPVPAGQEPVDYVLFESKEGYCNYYSGSMVVMLRSLGIPARVAAGFAQGTRDSTLGAFRVAESDAHSWVEAYFPGYGWIEFEPTASIDPIIRPAVSSAGLGFPADPRSQNPDGSADDPNQQLPDAGLDSTDVSADQPATLLQAIQNFRIPPIVWWLFVLVLLITAGGVGMWFFLEQRGMGNLSDVSRSYARLNLFAPLVGLPLEDSATPKERAAKLGWGLPQGEAHIDRIAALYIDEQYAPPRDLQEMEADRDNSAARDEWKLLRPTMIKAALKQQLQRIMPSRR